MSYAVSSCVSLYHVDLGRALQRKPDHLLEWLVGALDYGLVVWQWSVVPTLGLVAQVAQLPPAVSGNRQRV